MPTDKAERPQDTRLPFEVLSLILHLGPRRMVLRAARVCQHWRSIATVHDEFYKVVFLEVRDPQDFGAVCIALANYVVEDTPLHLTLRIMNKAPNWQSHLRRVGSALAACLPRIKDLTLDGLNSDIMCSLLGRSRIVVPNQIFRGSAPRLANLCLTDAIDMENTPIPALAQVKTLKVESGDQPRVMARISLPFLRSLEVELSRVGSNEAGEGVSVPDGFNGLAVTFTSGLIYETTKERMDRAVHRVMETLAIGRLSTVYLRVGGSAAFEPTPYLSPLSELHRVAVHVTNRQRRPGFVDVSLRIASEEGQQTIVREFTCEETPSLSPLLESFKTVFSPSSAIIATAIRVTALHTTYQSLVHVLAAMADGIDSLETLRIDIIESMTSSNVFWPPQFEIGQKLVSLPLPTTLQGTLNTPMLKNVWIVRQSHGSATSNEDDGLICIRLVPARVGSDEISLTSASVVAFGVLLGLQSEGRQSSQPELKLWQVRLEKTPPLETMFSTITQASSFPWGVVGSYEPHAGSNK
ncbi:hypothetical protein BKA62DRAFT_719559 [Auriculariales sp. MPI-PUGE-AT-0066]|nr:hypothetical protein BKA62DRAFT_719559 [Auriculariales sp. MPI-PUGE-AT-0066]